VHLEEGGLGRAGHANFLSDRADLFLSELVERLAVAPHVGDTDALGGFGHPVEHAARGALPALGETHLLDDLVVLVGSAPLRSNCTPIAILSSFRESCS
jgi:hypothetical protein